MRTAELGTHVERKDSPNFPIRMPEAGQEGERPFPSEAIDLVRQEDLADLMAEREGPCVSLFLPTHRSGQEKQQDPARLKNLLREAKSQLEAHGLEADAADALLVPAAELVDDGDFWFRQGDGLAVFVAPGFFRTCRLAVELSEKVAVGKRFLVRPLLPGLTPEDTLYVLALSLNQVRLLEVRALSCRRIDDPRLPKDMESALDYNYSQKTREQHIVGPRGSAPGKNGGISHGHGDNDEENAKIDQLNYFRMVTKALSQVLPNRKAPLVLASVAEHLPRFEEAANGDSLPPLAGSIPGNPDHLSDDELAKRGQELLALHRQEALDQEIQSFREIAGTPRTKQDLVPLVPAAAYGRVDTLYLAEEAESRFGTFDYDTGKVQVHHGHQNGNEDLLEKLVRDTLGNSGRVVSLPRELMPDGNDLAAVLRY